MADATPNLPEAPKKTKRQMTHEEYYEAVEAMKEHYAALTRQTYSDQDVAEFLTAKCGFDISPSAVEGLQRTAKLEPWGRRGAMSAASNPRVDLSSKTVMRFLISLTEWIRLNIPGHENDQALIDSLKHMRSWLPKNQQ